MEDLSLHILDIVENSIDAGAHQILIRILVDEARDRLIVDIVDDGRGMGQAASERALDPFFTTRKTRRVGLGLSLFREAARATGGDLVVRSQPGRGTRVHATFGYRHIDRKPIGDIAATLETLIATHPDIRFRLRQRKNARLIRIDSADFPARNGEVMPDLRALRERLRATIF